MQIKIQRTLCFLGIGLGGLFLSSCNAPVNGSQALRSLKPVPAVDYVKKVDNFLILTDSSASMGEKHKGKAKFTIATAIDNGINVSAPHLGYQTGLQNFATATTQADLRYGITSHNRKAMEEVIQSLSLGNGTPLPSALQLTQSTLQPLSGKSALIIVSDGKADLSKSLSAGKSLVQKMPNRICISTVQVGDDPNGKELLQKLAKLTNCGGYYKADNLMQAKGMQEFITATLLRKAHISDHDHDGVPDVKDQCPNTPFGAKVDQRGCWVIQGVLFDTDSAVIKPGYNHQLLKVVTILHATSGVHALIEGHTDNRASAAHNLRLSERRAMAVRNFLIQHGIKAERLSIKGYGFSRPIASNDTEEGRARNRRVEISIR